jgi:SAM-dependent methyltransferase
MRYKIKGIEIRSENAAKPACDASSYLVNWLHNREHTPSALDFGCGKLRYTNHLAKKSARVGIVDSEIQLTRIQRFEGKYISLKEYVNRKWPRWRIHRLEDFWINPKCSYSFILCANVLSAIPCAKARARSLRSIHDALFKNGQVLFVNQHTNSYFKEVQKRKTTLSHLDGWINQSRNGAAYYGILDKNFVVRIISRYNFIIEKIWIEGQSNYVLAGKK